MYLHIAHFLNYKTPKTFIKKLNFIDTDIISFLLRFVSCFKMTDD